MLFAAIDRMSGTLRRIDRSLRRTEQQSKRTARSLRSIDLVIGSIVTGKIIGLIRTFGEMGSELEQLRVRIGIFERGMGGVDGVMAQVNDQFGKTPFALETIGQTFTRLKASGIDPLDGSLKALLDGVAAFGGGSQELQRAGIAIQQIAGKGVVSMEELRQQLGEAIPFAMRVMANQMQISVAELIRQVERGELAAQEGLTNLFEGLEATFGGVGEAMVNTMAGAFERVKKEVQSFSDTFFNAFKLAPAIGATFNKIADFIKAFRENLSQETVDRYREFFIQLIALAVRLAPLLLGIIDLIVRIGGPVLAAINRAIDQAALLTRFITSGFSIEAVAELEQQMKEAGISTDAFRDSIIKAAEDGQKAIDEAAKSVQNLANQIGLSKVNLDRLARIEKSFNSVQASIDAVETLPFVAKIERLRDQAAEFGEGLDQERKRLRALNDELNNTLAKTGGKVTDDVEALFVKVISLNNAIKDGEAELGRFNSQLVKLESGLQENFLDKLSLSFEKIDRKVADIRQQLTGNDLQQANARTLRTFGDIRAELEKQLDKAQRTRISTEQRAALINRILQSIRELNALEEQSLQRNREIFDLQQRAFQLREKAARSALRIETGRRTEELNRLRSPLLNVLPTDAADQAREQRRALGQQQLEIASRIADLQLQAAQVQNDPARAAAIQQRILLLQDMAGVLEKIRERTTATALLEQELWQKVGETIQRSLTDALVGLVNRTNTVQDVLVSMFNRITQAAAEYLVQLTLIKAAQSGIGAALGGFGGGGGLLGLFLGGARSGAAFRGQVTPFANGGIVRGPTMFGLAGEAGEEAILPLQRVGGQLGVRAEGVGGDTNITIKAIDTQTGTQFLLENLDTIEAGVNQDRNLTGVGER